MFDLTSRIDTTAHATYWLELVKEKALLRRCIYVAFEIIDGANNLQGEVDDFLSGSKTFFKMVLESFANGNVENIAPYLKPSVLKSFKSAINERIKEKETEIIELNSIKKNEIRSVSLTKTSIKISVFFETLQVRALMNKDSKVIDGDKDNEILVKDEWVFERKINSDNPNWVLVETKSV